LRRTKWTDSEEGTKKSPEENWRRTVLEGNRDNISGDRSSELGHKYISEWNSIRDSFIKDLVLKIKE
jgi:hypothetical protein